MCNEPLINISIRTKFETVELAFETILEHRLRPNFSQFRKVLEESFLIVDPEFYFKKNIWNRIIVGATRCADGFRVKSVEKWNANT